MNSPSPFLLNLIEARAYADGAVLHVYRRLPDERLRIIEAGEALALPRLVTGSGA